MDMTGKVNHDIFAISFRTVEDSRIFFLNSTPPKIFFPFLSLAGCKLESAMHAMDQDKKREKRGNNKSSSGKPLVGRPTPKLLFSRFRYIGKGIEQKTAYVKQAFAALPIQVSTEP